MIELTGDKSFAASADSLWLLLDNLHGAVKAIPNVDRIVSLESAAAEIVVRPNLAFASGAMTLKLRKSSSSPPHTADWRIQTSGIGSSSEVLAHFDLLPIAPAETSLVWRAEIASLGGLLKLVPQSVISAAGKKIVADILAGIEEHHKIREEKENEKKDK